MTIYYDKEIDYPEFFFKSIENYGENLNKEVTVFKGEKTDEVVKSI